MQLLNGKTALITGGTAGIGKAIAVHFVQNGADVIIWGTNAQRGEQALVDLESVKSRENQKISLHLVDVSKTKDVDLAMVQALTLTGKIDVLVNNAGITRDQLLMKMSEEDWDQVLDINLKSVYQSISSNYHNVHNAS